MKRALQGRRRRHPPGGHRRRLGLRPRPAAWRPRVNLDAVRLLNRLRSPHQLVIYPEHQQRLRRHLGRVVLHRGQPAASRSRSTAGPRSRRSACCSTARTPSPCAWRPCSACRRGCGSICWSTISSTRPSRKATSSSSRRTSSATSSTSATWPTACCTASPTPAGWRAGRTTSAWTRPTCRRRSWPLKVKEHVPQLLHPLRPDRPGPGQAQLHRLQPAAARGRLRGEAIARRRHPRTAQGLPHGRAGAVQERGVTRRAGERAPMLAPEMWTTMNITAAILAGGLGTALAARRRRPPQGPGPGRRPAVPGVPARSTGARRHSRKSSC